MADLRPDLRLGRWQDALADLELDNLFSGSSQPQEQLGLLGGEG